THQLGEILIGEPTQFGCCRQCAIDGTKAIDLGQRDGRDHLGAHACGAHRGRTDQPMVGTWSDRQERGLVWRPGPRRPLQRTLRWWSEVGWIMTRLAWYGRLPTRDFMWPVAADVHDHDLVILLPHPDALAGVVIRHRVLAALEVDDRQVLAHVARDAEHRGVWFGRQRMESLAFLGQPLVRRAACGTVRTS